MSVHAEVFGKNFHRRIARDLMVFDRLRGADQTGIKCGLVLEVFHDTYAFFEDSGDRLALFGDQLLTGKFENLLQPFDREKRLLAVGFKHPVPSNGCGTGERGTPRPSLSASHGAKRLARGIVNRNGQDGGFK